MCPKGDKPLNGKRNTYTDKNEKIWAKMGKIGQHGRTTGKVCPVVRWAPFDHAMDCLLYTSDAADEISRVDLGGRRIITKKKA